MSDQCKVVATCLVKKKAQGSEPDNNKSHGSINNHREIIVNTLQIAVNMIELQREKAMGKKTKKQKIRALEHKIHALEQGRHVHIRVPEITRGAKPTIAEKVPTVREKQVKVTTVATSDEDTKLRRYFIHDFQKSIVLVVAIVAVEIALYFIF